MTTTHVADTLWARITKVVVDRWTTPVPSELAAWRTVRAMVPIEGTLASHIGWDTTVATVYSVPAGSSTETLGLGCAKVLEAKGQDSVGDIQSRMTAQELPDGSTWFGAFSFDSSIPPQGIWSNWPNAIWFVPRLTLRRRFSDSTVEIEFLHQSNQGEEDVKRTLDALFASFSQSVDVHTGTPDGSETWLDNTDSMLNQEEWSQLIQDALLEIEHGTLKKVVLARQTSLRVGATLEESLRRLAREYQTSHVFSMQWNGQWLVGASPEQLIRVEDGVMHVDCLAGSTARDGDSAKDDALAEALMCSRKNRAEHAAVVEFVTHQLATVAEDLEFADAPQMKRLANVQHLYTPIRGRLRQGRHLLDAAKLLHPTPAVGGVPRPAALSFIREREGWPRGYYAGAFGFIGGNGDGLLSVALRTAVVRSSVAILFAGCGIVEGSEGNDEWRETELKLAPMRMALT